jgi:predicted RNA-binding Zn ribbon-like protein
MANRPAILVAGAPGIDFLNSVATPVDKPIDWLSSGAGLVDWLHQAGFVPSAALNAIKSATTPRKLDRIASQARDLREWFRTFLRAHLGRPIDGKALREFVQLNRLLQRDESFVRIVSRGTVGRLQIERARRWRSPESLLIPIAEAIARVIVEEDLTRLKACEGETCTLLFVDRTRGEGRRWCSMEVCGNRAKVSAHRKRMRRRGHSKQARKL